MAGRLDDTGLASRVTPGGFVLSMRLTSDEGAENQSESHATATAAMRAEGQRARKYVEGEAMGDQPVDCAIA